MNSITSIPTLRTPRAPRALAALAALAVGGVPAALAQCPMAPQPIVLPLTAPCSATLAWPAVANATQYTIFRSTTPGELGSVAGVVSALVGTSPIFTDTAVPPGQVFYTVRSSTSPSPSCPAGLGADSPQLGATSTFQPVASMGLLTVVPVCNGFDVSWNAVAGAAEYRWEIATSAAPSAVIQAGFVSAGSGGGGGVLAAEIRLLSPQPGPFIVSVTPRNPCTPGLAASAQRSTLNGPGVPAGSLVAVPTPEGNVRLSWSPAPGAQGYLVTRNGPDGSVILEQVAGTTLLDTVMPGAFLYDYCVRAVHACGPTGNTTFCAAAASVQLPGVLVATQPGIVEAIVGGSATLRVEAAGTPIGPGVGVPLAYAWRRDGVPLVDGGSGGRISGAGTPALTISGLTLADQGAYEVVISRPGLSGSQPVVVPAALLVSNPCRADFNESGGREVGDIFAFLSAWFAGCP